MKLVFISDLHLSPDTPDNNQLMFSLLESWQHNLDGLYILGDFFDYYLGDDDNNKFILSIKQAFYKFTRHVPIYFIHGNHDFVLGRRFVRESGVQIIRDLTTIKAARQTILLSHGDVFCSLDIAYQRMKKILRNPVVQFTLLQTPLSWRYKLKDFLENKSATSFNTQPNEIYQVVDKTIVEIAQQKQANIVIHGHTHHPGRYFIQADNYTLERYEIPDWTDMKRGGYIMLEGETISIHS